MFCILGNSFRQLINEVKFNQIKDRRIIRIISAYAAICWVILQIIDQVVDRSVLPEIVYKVSLTLVLSLSPGILIIAWFHGAKGVQKIPAIEKWLVSVVVLFSLFSCILVLRANVQRNEEMGIEQLAIYEDPRRIAVLYFEPRGETKDAELISNGVTESLIDNLSSIPELHVVSQNGSQHYRHSEKSLEEIGKSLHVGLLVNGSVQLSNQKVRLRLSLVETSTGRLVESSRIEGSSLQMFSLIDSISVTVSNFLRKKIGEEVDLMQVNRRTSNLDAWNLVQEADLVEDVALQNASGESDDLFIHDIKVADSLYSLAGQMDQQWPVPPVKRGWLAYRQARKFYSDLTKTNYWISIGLGHAEHALELDPRLPDALELKATLLYWSWMLHLSEDQELTFQQSEQLFNESIKQNPKQASALNSLSHLYLNKGWIAEAKHAAETAYSIDHYLTDVERTIWRLLSISYDLGDTQEAKRWCTEGLSRFPDDYRFSKGMIMLNTMPGIVPNIDEAWTYFEHAKQSFPEYDSIYHAKTCLQLMAMALTKANLIDSARNVSLRGKATAEEDPARDIAFLESIVHLWMDDKDESIRLIGLHFSANPGLAEGYREAYENQSLYWYQSGLYGEPRFEALLGSR